MSKKLLVFLYAVMFVVAASAVVYANRVVTAPAVKAETAASAVHVQPYVRSEAGDMGGGMDLPEDAPVMYAAHQPRVQYYGGCIRYTRGMVLHSKGGFSHNVVLRHSSCSAAPIIAKITKAVRNVVATLTATPGPTGTPTLELPEVPPTFVVTTPPPPTGTPEPTGTPIITSTSEPTNTPEPCDRSNPGNNKCVGREDNEHCEQGMCEDGTTGDSGNSHNDRDGTPTPMQQGLGMITFIVWGYRKVASGTWRRTALFPMAGHSPVEVMDMCLKYGIDCDGAMTEAMAERCL